jgi:hypothetical protein
METQLTFHAHKRMKERLGIKSLTRAEILAEKAWINGKPVELDKKLLEEHVCGESWQGKDYQVKTFRNAIFVFTPDGCLITVFVRPANLLSCRLPTRHQIEYLTGGA